MHVAPHASSIVESRSSCASTPNRPASTSAYSADLDVSRRFGRAAGRQTDGRASDRVEHTLFADGDALSMVVSVGAACVDSIVWDSRGCDSKLAIGTAGPSGIGL